MGLSRTTRYRLVDDPRLPSFRTQRRVRHAPAEMFDLVADVEKYPLFVPLCQGLTVRSREQDGQGRTVLVAAMTVAYKLLRETFASRVTLDPSHRTVLVEYLDGPFSKLENRWTFEDDGRGGCTVVFFIDYQFRSRALALVMGAVFDQAFRRFADAFERRADQVYPRRAEPAQGAHPAGLPSAS